MSRYDSRIKPDDKGEYFFVINAGRYETGEKKGKRRQIKRRGYKSKREAHEALVEIEFQIKNGTFVDSSQVKEETPCGDKTIHELVEEWSQEKRREIVEDSLRYYMNGIRRIDEELGDLRLKDVTKKHLDEFLSKLLEEDFSSTYIDMIFRPLKKIFKEAHEDGVIQINPLKKIKLPSKKKSTSPETWNEEDSIRFLQSVRERFLRNENRTYIIYSLALFTGMRIGEILGLTWVNVNFDEKYIMVKQTVNNYGKVLNRTKSKSSTRMIMISDQLVEDLKLQKEAQEIEADRLEYKTDLVICTTKGNPFVPKNISVDDFKREVQHVDNLKKIRFHDLRHTHASLLLAKGIPAKVVQERLGHSSISITLDIYSHVVPQLQREVANKLDMILSVAV